jgi:hypothetical protein
MAPLLWWDHLARGVVGHWSSTFCVVVCDMIGFLVDVIVRLCSNGECEVLDKF